MQDSGKYDQRFDESVCLCHNGDLYEISNTGKSPEEIRKTFNIKNDFTPEEEEQVSRCLSLLKHQISFTELDSERE